MTTGITAINPADTSRQQQQKTVAAKSLTPVDVVTGAKVTKITDDSITYEKDGEVHTVSCDTVLNAAGFKPNNQLEDLLEEEYDDKVVVIGDAVAPRKILTAIHEGYHAIRVME